MTSALISRRSAQTSDQENGRLEERTTAQTLKPSAIPVERTKNGSLSSPVPSAQILAICAAKIAAKTRPVIPT